MHFMRLLTKEKILYSEIININEIINIDDSLDFSFYLEPLCIQFDGVTQKKVKESKNKRL